MKKIAYFEYAQLWIDFKKNTSDRAIFKNLSKLFLNN